MPSQEVLARAKSNLINSHIRNSTLKPFMDIKKMIWNSASSADKERLAEDMKYASVLNKRLKDEFMLSRRVISGIGKAEKVIPSFLFSHVALERNATSLEIMLSFDAVCNVLLRGYRSQCTPIKNILVKNVVFEFENCFQLYNNEDYSVCLRHPAGYFFAISYEDSGEGIKGKSDFKVYYVDRDVYIVDSLSKYAGIV